MLEPIFLKTLERVYSDGSLNNVKFGLLEVAIIADSFQEVDARKQFTDNLSKLGFKGNDFNEAVANFNKGTIGISDLMISSDMFIDIPYIDLSISKDLEVYIFKLLKEIFDKDEIEISVEITSDKLIIISSDYKYSIELSKIIEDRTLIGGEGRILTNQLNLKPVIDLAQQFSDDNNLGFYVDVLEFYDLFVGLSFSFKKFIELFPNYDIFGKRYAILKVERSEQVLAHSKFPIMHELNNLDQGHFCHINMRHPEDGVKSYLLTASEKKIYYNRMKMNLSQLNYGIDSLDQIFADIMNQRINTTYSLHKYLSVNSFSPSKAKLPLQLPEIGGTIRKDAPCLFSFFNDEFEVQSIILNAAKDSILVEHDNRRYSIANSNLDLLILASRLITVNEGDKRTLLCMKSKRGRIYNYYFLDRDFADWLEEFYNYEYHEVSLN